MSQTLLDVRTDCFKKITTPEPVKYDLGCGQNPEEGFVGIDFFAKGEGIINADLYSYPWPIADESVDYFRSSHFIEHVPDWDAHFVQIYRCLKPGGYYEILAPYYSSRRFYQDPDHKQPVLEERFAYLSHLWRKQQKLEHYGAEVNFRMLAWFERWHEDFDGMSDDARVWHKLHSFNVLEDVGCVLVKRGMDEE